MAEMNTTTAELLQQMIDIKKDTRASIERKGVSVFGGMETYPAAIESISQVFAGTEIDFTRAGWLQSDSDAANDWESKWLEDALQYSNLMWQLYGDYLNWPINTYGRWTPTEFYKMVIAPKIVNFGADVHLAHTGIFKYCSDLQYVPAFDISNTTLLSEMFSGCSDLKYVQKFDTQHVTHMSSMFYRCLRLVSIPQLDTSNVIDMSNMFAYCTRLTTVPALDLSKVSDVYGMFIDCESLENLGGFPGLGKSMTSISFDLSDSPLLTHESLMNVINGLEEVSDKSLVLGETNLAKLTSSQIAIATNKGWTLT